MNKFLITIARRFGLTDSHCDELKHYFGKRFTSVVCNVEPHKTGLWHMHAYVECKVSRAAVRNHLVKFLEKDLGIEVGPKTCNVKKADDGARQYVVKDVTADEPVTLCQGWSIEGLLEERRQALKKLSRKEVMGNWKVISQDEAVPLLLKFALSSQIAVTDRTSFKQLCIAMMREKFSFSRLKMSSVYAEVMVQLGDDRLADDWLEMQLCGMR